MLDRSPEFPGIRDDAVRYDSAQHGFTLTEMMATLAIAAISATLAIPTMKNISANGQRSAGANKLVATLHAARSTAITRNAQVTICPSSDAEQCDDTKWRDGWIYFVDQNQDRLVDTDETVLGSEGSIANTRIISPDFEKFLAFRPNGHIMGKTTADNSGELLLCDDRGAEFSRSLILHVGGKPQLIVDEKNDAYAACATS